MSIKLFEKLNAGLVDAVRFHQEQSDLFLFLALKGFQAIHEFQAVEEQHTQRTVKRFITETYGQTPLDPLPNVDEMPVPVFRDAKRGAVDVRDAVQKSYSQYHAWEQRALDNYTAIANELKAAGDVAGFVFVSEIVSEVREELATLHNEHLQLIACDFDMPTIIAIQPEIEKDYKKRLKKVF